MKRALLLLIGICIMDSLPRHTLTFACPLQETFTIDSVNYIVGRPGYFTIMRNRKPYCAPSENCTLLKIDGRPAGDYTGKGK